MSEARAVLAVDAGQTGVKVRLDRDGHRTELQFDGIRTNAALLPQLARVVDAVRLDSGTPIDAASFGVSGLTGAEADAANLLPLLGGSGVRRVLLGHDSITSFLGALGDVAGAVVAAGTGVVTLAVGETKVARVDGWGNIMGDSGSGYWIGREALDVAMRAHDGRGAPTALLDVLRERWPDVENAYIDLQTDPDRVRVVASFAEAVGQLADSDAAATQIALRAARELSRSVVAGLERVQGTAREPELVCAIGGVFSSAVIRDRFESLVCEARDTVSIARPRGQGLDGAALLPTLALDHPLRAHVSVAAAA